MTASTTPRLGLLLPSSSDNFTIDDFDDTMTKLDNTPGITNVANYAAIQALQTTLTANQHGSTFCQLDNGALWQWVKPGSAAGSFRRLNSLGLLAATVQPSAVSTTATTQGNGPVVLSSSFTCPGGRAIALQATLRGYNSNSTIPAMAYEIYLNGGQYTNTYFGYTVLHANGGNREVSGMAFYRALTGATPPGTPMTATLRLRSVSSSGGTSASSAGSCAFYAYEL